MLPVVRDTCYDTQATNSDCYAHQLLATYQCLAAYLVRIAVYQIAGEHNSRGATQQWESISALPWTPKYWLHHK